MAVRRIKNYTPHPVRMLVGGGTFTFDPTEKPARVLVKEDDGDALMGIPVSSVEYGEVIDLPEEEEGTALIVSQLVAQRLEERDDLYFPTGIVRDEVNKKIIGATRLGKIRRTN